MPPVHSPKSASIGTFLFGVWVVVGVEVEVEVEGAREEWSMALAIQSGSEYEPCAVCFVELHEIFVQRIWAVPIFPVADSYTTESALYGVLEASFEVIGMEVARKGEGLRRNELMKPIGIRFVACGDRLEVWGLRRGRVAVRVGVKVEREGALAMRVD